ncbi:uncharacterized protein LOC116171519 isoform X1 [Photinus pyralis]|uniref:uncharacterized protein LOC116159998 isoform X1 n=1 Tax=Photinus pyralis TaxID=7054 RepID=UPI0012676BA4|nr:uncharacterized protein LOC116159998 isoform X1 [Photinus pyralis]XP_031328969.1 uncharacterized protein LOC116159998 isoform X1 [Photinus pyralis]XP_031328970.1 uncharacterized protein LOC116159998 isoform X1 [Photinus pyralis]XP_031344255.1 uncharacterized protein LOC116171519 isoform X1 [Photinus pyralis]
MTSQAERIKAFKLAQHARLRKQDEEEQWISSEELCTEGSSDEESHASTTSHRKMKRNKPQKRGISPLAQLPKKESTSSNLQESKYLFPERVQSVDKANSQKSVDSKNSESEESIDESEMEKMIQWRPKRGSIKLPDFPEETTQDHLSKMDYGLYTEMSIVVRRLNQRPLTQKCHLVSHETIAEEYLPKQPIQDTSSATVSTLSANMFQLDSKINEKDLLYQKVKGQRKVAQNEMCMLIFNDNEPRRDTQKFLELCHFDVKRQTTEIEDSKECRPKIRAKTYRKSFLIRNIHVAKFYSMAKSSLTDEEKLKLETLLADDSEESPTSNTNHVEKSEKANETHSEEDSSDYNYFKMKTEEKSLMANLTTQLQEILHSYGEDCNKLETSEGDVLECADNEGKFWKHDQLQQRLEHIQKRLNQIAVKDAEEQERLSSIHLNSNE